MSSKVEQYIAVIPDFPKPGIIFRDITPVTEHPDGLQAVTDELAACIEGMDVDVITGIEARGFLFGAPVAYKLGTGFVAIRKKGKLPRETVSEEYELEYGTAAIEINADSIKPGQKVVIIDDLIATGGTAAAAAKLVEKLGGEVVKILFLIELKGLEGRKALEGYDVESLVAYEGK